MSKVKILKCIGCGKEYEKINLYNCPECKENLDVLYDYGRIKKIFNKFYLAKNTDYSIWRYLPILPVDEKFVSSLKLKIGWTPLYEAKSLGNNLYLKDDGRNPSCSFKDRESAVPLMIALKEGHEVICCASTGNAGSSMSCLAANAQIRAVIFVPENAPRAKMAQISIFGAKIIKVKGNYDDAYDLCLEASEKYKWYNRSTGYNPYTREGMKTGSYEVWEQLGFSVPDKIFVPVGDGNIISGIGKGFRDLKMLGLIDKLPQLIAVQSELSNAIATAIKTGQKIKPVKATTVADSINVDMPRDGLAAVKAVTESGGEAVEVSDGEILSAIKIIAQKAGVFTEPAAAASYAGYKKLYDAGRIKDNEKVVCLITGSGLKDIDSAMKVLDESISIEPRIELLEKILCN